MIEWARVGVLLVLGVQGVVGYFGYEIIDRLQAVLTVVLFVTFAVLTVSWSEARFQNVLLYISYWVPAFAAIVAYLAAIPFMNTPMFVGSLAERWHGADVAYFVNFLVALALYGGYRWIGRSGSV